MTDGAVEMIAPSSGQKNRALGGLLVRKYRWALAWWAKLLLVVTGIVVAVGAVLGAYPFLAITQPVNADILVVEGWVHPYAIRAAMQEFQEPSVRTRVHHRRPGCRQGRLRERLSNFRKRGSGFAQGRGPSSRTRADGSYTCHRTGPHLQFSGRVERLVWKTAFSGHSEGLSSSALSVEFDL